VDSSIIYDLVALHARTDSHTPRTFLAAVAEILEQHLHVDVVICFELIPETGGIPRLPAVCVGPLQDSQDAPTALEELTHTGMIGQLILWWKMHYYEEQKGQNVLNCYRHENDAYSRFMTSEGIQSFVFLPLGPAYAKRGIILLNCRHDDPLPDEEWQAIQACGVLTGSSLAQINHQVYTQRAQQSRMATAHTLYNEIANRFRAQIGALETSIAALVGDGNCIPPVLADDLRAAKQTVFEVMRDLVIQASGDLLIDLRSMTLAKALNTAIAALERAWLPDQRIAIELAPIPPVIERQPLALRRLLYALVLEALGNAIRHGGPAPYVFIELSWHNRQVCVEVLDHGQGFDARSAELSEHGLGFWQRTITEHLAGTLTVSSKPGHGAVVVAKIPTIPVRRGHDVDAV
jgi:K+-sensing histidine kinase KdpD